MMTVVAADGKTRDMVMVDSQTIPLWLPAIDERRINAKARPTLIAYQRDPAGRPLREGT